MNGQNLTVLISHDVNDILNSKVQANKGTIFKAAVTLEVSKALGIEYHLHCSWRPQFSGKKKKSKRLVQFSSVSQSCLTLCDPMNRSTPGLPVHHQLLEFTKTHVHRVSDAIQPSHPLSSPSPPAPNPSQHQSLFQ